MKDITFISSSYISLREAFLSVPVPANQFSLLMPTQDNEPVGCETLDDIYEVFALHSLNCSLEEFQVIDKQLFNCIFGTKFPAHLLGGGLNKLSLSEPAVVNKAKEQTVCKTRTIAGRPSWRISLGTKLDPKPASAAKLPEWLVGTEVRQKLYNMEALDGTGKRFDLMLMGVGEPKASRENGKENLVAKSNEGLGKNIKQHIAVPPKAVPASHTRGNVPVVRSTREALLSIGLNENVTLLSDKLMQHFNKLSNVGVPVLRSNSGPNIGVKVRRKQQLGAPSTITAPTPAKQRRMSTVKDLTGDRRVVLGAGTSALSHDENANVCQAGVKDSRNTRKQVSKRILRKSTINQKTVGQTRERTNGMKR
ncbi:uncharacterized protein LOC121588809 [Anopheles merus]|uniref:uncharacterized protein LOC121588809 n=1 Tax=Anopheles merus TaxID=30066 RepID=UPI001BE4C112|nr:uncharacterized protein LOC121588809 [Anopheles merus]